MVPEQIPTIPSLEEYWYDKLTPLQLGNDACALEHKSIYKYPLLDNLSVYASNSEKLGELTNRIKSITEELQERNFELYIRKRKVGLSKEEEACFKNIEDYFAVYSAHIYWMAGEGGAIWPYDLDAKEQSLDDVFEEDTLSNSIIFDNSHANSISNDNVDDFFRVDNAFTKRQDAEDNAQSLEIQAAEASKDYDKTEQLEAVIEGGGAQQTLQGLINQGSDNCLCRDCSVNIKCAACVEIDNCLHSSNHTFDIEVAAIINEEYVNDIDDIESALNVNVDKRIEHPSNYCMKEGFATDFSFLDFVEDSISENKPVDLICSNIACCTPLECWVDFIGVEKHLLSKVPNLSVLNLYFNFPFYKLSCIELKLENDQLHSAITSFAYIHGLKSVILSCDLAPDPFELCGVEFNMFKSVIDPDVAINELQCDYMVPCLQFVPNVECSEFVDFVGCEKHLSSSRSYSNLLTTYAVKHNPSDPNSFHGFKYFDACGVLGIGHNILIDFQQANYLKGFTHTSQIPYSSNNLLIEPKQVCKRKRLSFLLIFLSSYKPP